MKVSTWVMALAVVFAMTLSAEAATYSEGFETDLAGWTGSGTPTQESPGGANGTDGWMRTERDSVYGGQHRTAVLAGDWEATFGNLVEISYYAKVISPAPNPTQDVRAFIEDSGWWYGPFQPVGSDWTAMSLSIDTNWTDAEAQAAGWVLGGGSQSFSDIMHSLTTIGFVDFQGPSAPTVTGFDEITITPEPASLLLFVAAGLMLTRRRR